MLLIKFCLWIFIVLTCVRGNESTATWVRETSIANGLSLAGRITTVDNVNLGQCIVECYLDKSCVTVGVSESVNGCQLYDLDLEDHKHITTQMDTSFYKSVCDNQAYTYVRRLDKCIRRSAVKVVFDVARDSCQADGGDLLMVKDNDVRLYLKDIMLSVTDTSNYWIGATEDPGNSSLWYWVDGTQMTSETGWMFWAENNPSPNIASVCLHIKTEYGDVVFNDRNCEHVAGVLCEVSP